MSSQPPYGNYPSQNQPWPEQPSEGSSSEYGQPGAYPPPPSYGGTAYPSQPYYQPPQQPMPSQPSQPYQGQPPAYGAPNIYVQPAAYPYMVAAPAMPAEPGSGQAVAGFVLGIVSTVFAFIPCLGLIAPVTGIVGLILSILGRKSVTRHGLAITGIVLSSIGIGLSVIFTILWIGLNTLPFLLTPTQ